MKKILTLFLTTLLLCGCANSSTHIDIHKLANELMEKGVYETSFIELDEDQIESFYPNSSTVSNTAIVYESDSQEMELVALFETDKPEEVKKILVDRQSYLLNQAENYFPEQSSRIENALIMNVDNITLMIIADNITSLEEIIKNFK